jgi:hypothetical protein
VSEKKKERKGGRERKRKKRGGEGGRRERGGFEKFEGEKLLASPGPGAAPCSFAFV